MNKIANKFFAKVADRGASVQMESPEAMLHYAAPSGGAHTGANVFGEHYGAVTSLLASTLAGAAIGAIARGEVGAQNGAAIGLGAGALAHLGGFVGAGFTDRRTAAEQKAHDDSAGVAQWLVPGIAPYNRAKRVGRQMEQKNQEPDPTTTKKSDDNKSDDKKDEVKKEASAISKQASFADRVHEMVVRVQAGQKR